MLEIRANARMDYYDSMITNRDTVTCGEHALGCNGLTTSLTPELQCSTNIPGVQKVGLYPVIYYTMDSWNDLAYTRPSNSNPLLHNATAERALVEAMLYEYFNEGILIESLITYKTQFYNEDLLFEVADHFGLRRERLQYWLNEAEYERTHDES